MKRKIKAKDLELLPDPVWKKEDGMIMPTQFFLVWWQEVAEQRFGDRERWLDAASELGYVAKLYDTEKCKFYYEAVGFGFDPSEHRASLGIPDNMPIVSRDGSPDTYQRLWDYLLKEHADE